MTSNYINFIRVTNKNVFINNETNWENNNFNNIIFFLDTNEIWTGGKYYGNTSSNEFIKFKKIQTNNLSKPGWVRIAEINTPANGIVFISNTWGNNGNAPLIFAFGTASHTLIPNNTYITQLSGSLNLIILKARIVSKNSNQPLYLEIYYNVTKSNDLFISICDAFDKINFCEEFNNAEETDDTWNIAESQPFFNGMNINAIKTFNISSNKFIVNGGTASLFMKADGTLDSISYLPSTSYTAADVLNKLKTVDGKNSGLDADLFDGLENTQFFKQTYTSLPIGKILKIPEISSFNLIALRGSNNKRSSFAYISSYGLGGSSRTEAKFIYNDSTKYNYYIDQNSTIATLYIKNLNTTGTNDSVYIASHKLYNTEVLDELPTNVYRLDNVNSNILANLDSSVESANKLATPRKINLEGAVAGTVDFDGSNDVTISTNLTIPYCYGDYTSSNISLASATMPGWIRIAKVSPTSFGTIAISNYYNNKAQLPIMFNFGMSNHFDISGANNKAWIQQIGGSNTMISKARIVSKSATEQYLEVYYTYDKNNPLYITLSNSLPCTILYKTYTPSEEIQTSWRVFEQLFLTNFANTILELLKTVDGIGSGLEVDKANKATTADAIKAIELTNADLNNLPNISIDRTAYFYAKNDSTIANIPEGVTAFYLQLNSNKLQILTDIHTGNIYNRIIGYNWNLMYPIQNSEEIFNPNEKLSIYGNALLIYNSDLYLKILNKMEEGTNFNTVGPTDIIGGASSGDTLINGLTPTAFLDAYSSIFNESKNLYKINYIKIIDEIGPGDFVLLPVVMINNDGQSEVSIWCQFLTLMHNLIIHYTTNKYHWQVEKL